ncbi:MAG: hypothetical protein Q9224_006371, partial [Gallowayella concinna]
ALDHNEVLNVRWATMDPNPLAQKREARKIEEQAAEAVRRALPEEFVREIEGRDPEAKKRRRIEGGFGLEGYEAPDEIWYAKSRQIENGDLALEGGSSGDQPMLAEHAPAETQQAATTTGGGGILSGSTLAALQSYAAQNDGRTMRAAAPAPASSGPLVGYGSDDDSD